MKYIWRFVLSAVRTLRYTSRYRKSKGRGRVSGPVCHCPWSTPIGRGGRIAVPGPPWTPHPRHPLPLLLATRLSPSFPCESIVRSRGAPWLGSGTVRGWLLVGSRGLVEAVATTPEQQRRTPILRTTTGFGDRRISTSRVRSFLPRICSIIL